MTGPLASLFPFVMLSALLCGAILSRRYKSDLPIPPTHRLWIALFAFCGAVMAAKLPFVIPGLPGFQGARGILISGKTILLGLVGGYFGVELAKWLIGVKTKTGDTFVVPVATSIGMWSSRLFLRWLLLWRTDDPAVGNTISSHRPSVPASNTTVRSRVPPKHGRRMCLALRAWGASASAHQVLFLDILRFSLVDRISASRS